MFSLWFRFCSYVTVRVMVKSPHCLCLHEHTSNSRDKWELSCSILAAYGPFAASSLRQNDTCTAHCDNTAAVISFRCALKKKCLAYILFLSPPSGHCSTAALKQPCKQTKDKWEDEVAPFSPP